MRLKSLARNSFFNILYTLSNILFPLITSMYIARILLSDGTGRVSAAQNTTSYFILLAALGLPTYGIREVSKSRNKKEDLDKVFSELFYINFISTTIALVSYVMIVLFVGDYQKDIYLYLSTGLVLIFNYINVEWFFQGEEDFKYITVRSLIVKIIIFIATILLVKSKNDYILFALLNSIGTSGNYILSIFHIRKYVHLQFKNLNFKRHIITLLILAVGIFLSSIYNKIDISMLNAFSTEESIGLYSYAQRTVHVIITICITISGTFLPRLSFYYKNDRESFLKLIDLGYKVLCLISIPCSVGLFIIAPEAMCLLYGKSFEAASTTIRILCFIIVIISFGNLFGYQLTICTENEKYQLPVYTAAAMLNCFLNYYLIPKYFQNGAAISSLASESVVAGVLSIIMIKKHHIQLDLRPLSQTMIASLFMAIAVWGIKICFIGSLLMKTVLCVIIGIVVYCGMNYLMKNELTMLILQKVHKGL